VFAVLVPFCLFGQDRPAPKPARPSGNAEEAAKLPVKRVVLYKNGVGYFEHLGRVRDNQDVAISFTSGQLNDVLKTLTVLDLNGGRIAGVGYDSAAPIDRQLGDLHLPLGEKTSLTEFLGALRGARIEVRSGTSVMAGRLLSVERKTRTGGGTTLEVDYVSLITDGGELRTTEVSPSFTVRLLDPGLPGRVDRYLDLVSSAREADVRRMVISAEGTGERSLFVSYISEVPVWKTTYRIVLNSKTSQKPLLQGWAIVDNTVGQDWENVQLSLVAGAPQSFIQNLSQPYYARRPVVPLPESVSAAPQTYESTLIPGRAPLSGRVTDPSGAAIPGATVKAYDAGGALAGETSTDASGAYELLVLPEGPIRLEIEAQGFQRTTIKGVLASAAKPAQQNATLNVGSVAESVQVTAAAPTLQTESAQLGTAGHAGSGRMLGSGTNLGRSGRVAGGAGVGAGEGGGVGGGMYHLEPAARAQELGDLFEYKLKDPITIRKDHSALVPIVQTSIAAEKVSVWNEQAGLPRPQRALWLTNSSDLTLDGGSFSVMEEETFAGEGIFDPIRPGEKRLVSYATDLAVNASSKQASEQERVSHVRVTHGVMTLQNELREKKTYTFRNEDRSARTVIVEHPVRTGYTLRSEVQPAETTAAWLRFRLPVEPKQTASLAVEEARILHTDYLLTNLDSTHVDLFVRQQSINKTVEDALRRVLTQKSVVAELDTKKSALEDESEKIFDDQQRLRENMKALKGSAEERALLQRYTQQLNEQENRLEALNKQTAQLESQHDSAQEKLDQMIQELSFDVNL
jgi:chaperonin cofactor prefoldin